MEIPNNKNKGSSTPPEAVRIVKEPTATETNARRIYDISTAVALRLGNVESKTTGDDCSVKVNATVYTYKEKDFQISYGVMDAYLVEQPIGDFNSLSISYKGKKVFDVHASGSSLSISASYPEDMAWESRLEDLARK
jgi:hypothetical protein